jgi:undecaprenyl-diphosphatase
VGLVVTRVVFSVHAIENADEWLPEWAEGQRTPFRTDLSKIGSDLGDLVLIVSAGIAALALVARRRWRMAIFVIQAGLVEALAYLLIANAIERPRPSVQPLDTLNPNHSFPSGHMAASVAVYGAIALLLTAHFKRFWARVAIWSAASAIWLAVAASRIYRGEHHPIDLVAGVMVGAGALVVALFAARTARKVAELHASKRLEKARS